MDRILHTSLFVTLIGILYKLSSVTIEISADYALLVLFLCYCLGFHIRSMCRWLLITPANNNHNNNHVNNTRQILVNDSNPPPHHKDDPQSYEEKISLRSSNNHNHNHNNHNNNNSSNKVWIEPLHEIITNGKGSKDNNNNNNNENDNLLLLLGDNVSNSWSRPPYDFYKIRGPNYFHDRIKVRSGPFVFPMRGVDLFLTTEAPKNVGRNKLLFGGKLREKPTFIVNFRLPWGILVMYYEIPQLFVPYLIARYSESSEKKEELMKILSNNNNLSSSDKAVARFLLADDDTRNKTLKLVPVVVDGPWIVRQVVGGKPAIVGNKIPVQYVYGGPESCGDGREYLEADMDVVSSVAGRGILNVVQKHTENLTLDLGFVVEAKNDDELPEQMLGSFRFHGIKQSTAAPYPS